MAHSPESGIVLQITVMPRRRPRTLALQLRNACRTQDQMVQVQRDDDPARRPRLTPRAQGASSPDSTTVERGPCVENCGRNVKKIWTRSRQIRLPAHVQLVHVSQLRASRARAETGVQVDLERFFLASRIGSECLRRAARRALSVSDSDTG